MRTNCVRQGLQTAFLVTNARLTSSASDPFVLEYFGTNGAVVRLLTAFSNLRCSLALAMKTPPFYRKKLQHTCELSSRYAIPITDEEIKRAHEESVPKATRTDTAYYVRLWSDWAENRSKHTKEIVPPFDQLHDKSLLQCWLTRFVLKVRSKKGTEYTPNTLHHIVCGIMRHLQQNCSRHEIDIFKDPEFANFHTSLDAEMKRLQTAGVGSVKKNKQNH